MYFRATGVATVASLEKIDQVLVHFRQRRLFAIAGRSGLCQQLLDNLMEVNHHRLAGTQVTANLFARGVLGK